MKAHNFGRKIEKYCIIFQRGSATVLNINIDGLSAYISRFDLKQTVEDYDLDVEYRTIIFAQNQYGNGPKSAILFTVFACE